MQGQVSFQYDLPGDLASRTSETAGSPIILRQPANQVVSVGENGSFSVVVADTALVSYQWRFNGTNLSTATADTLLLPNVTSASQGLYDVIVANASGSVTSAPAMLWWDSVGDGLPDSWKQQYFGSLTNVTAAGDFVGDGVSNLEKFYEGINPVTGAGLNPRLSVSGLNGYISVSPDLDKYAPGQLVTLTPISVAGFQFVGWSGDLTGGQSPATLTMDTNKSVTAVFSLPLAYVLDATNITWRSGGDVPWFGQNYVTYDGIAAAQSGPIGTNQQSWLEGTLYMTNSGLLSFWYKAAGGANSIVLSINGAPQKTRLYGDQDWLQVFAFLPAGTDVIRWTYGKDAFFYSQGFDAAWLDQVTVTVYPDPLYDSDYDGLPDLWEYRYFGSLYQVGTGDLDGDGVNNHDEYLDGTDPTDYTSVFPRLAVAASGGSVAQSPAQAKYSYLQPVTLIATPSPGFVFTGWTGDLVASTNPAVLTMDRSKSVRAMFAMSSAGSVARALDATNLTWSTGGDVPWFGQTLATYDGLDAVQSGAVGPGQQSWLQTTVMGPGPLSFWWKVSSGYNTNLQFAVNGVMQTNIEGLVDWQQVTLNLPAGPNVLQWTYSDNGGVSFGTDAGWVDQVCFGTAVPCLTNFPRSQTVYQGSNVTLAVSATSSAALSYQWQKNGTNLVNGGRIDGATTAVLTVNNAQPNNTGAYSVVVSTPSGASSAAAMLTVIGLVPIAQAVDTPTWIWTTGGDASWLGQTATNHDGIDAAQSGAINTGQQSWLQTSANGPGVVSFWWKTSSQYLVDYLQFLIDGATNAAISGEVDWVPRSFVLPAGTHTLNWTFIRKSYALNGSELAWLDQVSFVSGLVPSIGTQPQAQTVLGGANVSFTVVASGTAPLNYQWFFNRTNLVGQNSATLSLTNVQLPNVGEYSVVVSNALGAATSASAALTVNVPPLLTAQPVGESVYVGDTANFSVTAVGASPLYYQWQLNQTNLPNATDSSLTLQDVQLRDAGPYRVVVTNWLGSVTSAVAQLTVNGAPRITTQPMGGSVLLGGSFVFSVTASGAGPLSYQWQLNSTNLPGATSALLVLSNIQATAQGTYDVVVTNLVGSATSYSAYLFIGGPPGIATQPATQTVPPGSFVYLNVSATGDAPLFYQWQKYGTNLAGATFTYLFLTNVQAADAGPYDVVVTNASGSVTSAVAVLTVTGTVPGNQPLVFIATSNGVANLMWTALFGSNYIVQYKNDLQAPYWSNLSSVITATNLFIGKTDNSANLKERFYRVELLSSGGGAPPVITLQPTNQTVSVGSSVYFYSAATGSAPLSYQWQMNYGVLPGATSPVLFLNNVQLTNIGIYDLVVTNSAGSVTSNPALLLVQ